MPCKCGIVTHRTPREYRCTVPPRTQRRWRAVAVVPVRVRTLLGGSTGWATAHAVLRGGRGRTMHVMHLYVPQLCRECRQQWVCFPSWGVDALGDRVEPGTQWRHASKPTPVKRHESGVGGRRRRTRGAKQGRDEHSQEPGKEGGRGG